MADLSGTLPVLMAFGNPLVDLCIRLPDNLIPQKFGVADDGIKEVTEEELEELLNISRRFPQEKCPGGSALNSVRVYQWLNNRPNSCIFFGAVGKDDRGKYLHEAVSKVGIDAKFVEHLGLPTGIAVSMIYNKYRTIIAHIGAANIYNLADFTHEGAIEKVAMVYIENFFFTHSKDLILDIICLCKKNGVATAFNLSGSYLFKEHGADIVTFIKYVDIVFGNESEFLALAKAMDLDSEELPSILEIVCNAEVECPPNVESSEVKSSRLTNVNRLKKVVVATRGHRPVICVAETCAMFETQVLRPEKGVKDTTGAGDAFVAGFLTGLLHDWPLTKCVQLGCYAACEIVQQIGCCPPSYPPVTLDEVECIFSAQLNQEGPSCFQRSSSSSTLL